MAALLASSVERAVELENAAATVEVTAVRGDAPAVPSNAPATQVDTWPDG